MRASVCTDRQVLLDRAAALPALLRGVPRVDDGESATGPFSLVAQHRDHHARRNLEDLPVEPGLLPDVFAWTFDRAVGGGVAPRPLWRRSGLRSQRSADANSSCGGWRACDAAAPDAPRLSADGAIPSRLARACVGPCQSFWPPRRRTPDWQRFRRSTASQVSPHPGQSRPGCRLLAHRVHVRHLNLERDA